MLKGDHEQLVRKKGSFECRLKTLQMTIFLQPESGVVQPR